jgi:hypothetical protein
VLKSIPEDRIRLLLKLTSLNGVITLLEDLKISQSYSDRGWIVIVLLSVSIAKTFQKVGDVPFVLRVGATLLWSQS